MTRLPTHRPPVHPGEVLEEEFLKPLGINLSEFARRIEVSYPRLHEIVRGKRGISTDTALRLERVTGLSAESWLTMQQSWDIWHLRRDPEEMRKVEHLQPLVTPQMAGK
jgi:addiction module HigA family antidote